MSMVAGCFCPGLILQLEQETEIKTLRWVLNENERGTKKS